MNAEQAKKLREPFPPEQIGTIPKGGVNLSYVGHAAVTDRLLQIDPEWKWEPFGLDEDTGNPILVENQGGMQGEPYGLWIQLTVCGITRPGFGGGKNAKECISDAIRNAAMRFGVALDLWAKEDLGHNGPEKPKPAAKPKPQFPIPAAAVPKLDAEAEEFTTELVKLMKEYGNWESDAHTIQAHLESSPDLRTHKDWLARGVAKMQENLKVKAALK